MGTKKSRLFYKYLISYLLVIVVPLFIFAFLGYTGFLQKMTADSQAAIENEIETVADDLDTLREDLQEIAYRLSLTVELSRYMIERDYLGPLIAKQELAKYKIANGNITDIWLYYKSIPGKVYTSAGSWNMDNLNDVSGMSASLDFPAVIDQYDLPVILPVDGLYLNSATACDYFMYLFAVNDAGFSPVGAIAFFVPKDVCLMPLGSMLTQYHGAVMVLDAQNRLIAFNGDQSELSLAQIDVHGLEPASDSNHIVFQSADNHSLRLVTFLDRGLYYANTRQSVKNLIIIVLLVLSVCMGAVLALTLKNNSPLQSIVRSLEGKYIEISDPRQANEIDVIRTTIQKMSDENRCMQNNQRLLDKHILSNLLFNRTSVDDRQYIAANLHIYDAFVCVAVFDRINDGIHDSLLFYSTKSAAAHLLKVDAYGHWVMLVGRAEPGMPPDIDAFLDELISLQIVNAKYTGIGIVHTGLDGIVRSYVEAMAAFNVARSRPYQNQVHFSKLKPNQGSQWYPHLDESRLEQSLLIGNEELAIESINTILNYAESWKSDLVKVRCIYNGLGNILIRESARLGQDYNEIAQNLEVLPQNVNQFRECLLFACRRICTQIRVTTDENEDRENIKIITYIRNHYADPMLSLEQLTGIFDRSESYLSHFIKDRSKMNFSELVWSLRFEEVKRQLKETDRPVKDIVSDVGYIDVSSFIRKFRKSTGVTPNAFRIASRAIACVEPFDSTNA